MQIWCVYIYIDKIYCIYCLVLIYIYLECSLMRKPRPKTNVGPLNASGPPTWSTPKFLKDPSFQSFDEFKVTMKCQRLHFREMLLCPQAAGIPWAAGFTLSLRQLCIGKGCGQAATGSDRQLEYDPKESMDMDWRPDNSIHTNFVPGENAVRIPKIQQ